MVDVSSVATDAIVKFAEMQRKLTQTTNTMKAEKEKLAKNANLKGPSGDVQEFQKTNNKSASALKFFATDIGLLVKDQSRLNVISTLAEGDKADFYKFRITGRGDAYLGRIGDDGARIQLMSQNGTVIADSNKDAGSAKERFDKLAKGELQLDPGQYHLRVSRDDPKDTKTKLNYALQVRMGDYKQDFDTVAKQPKSGDDPFAPTAAVQELQSMLTTSSSFLQNLQYGQSGSDKLMGNMFNGLF